MQDRSLSKKAIHRWEQVSRNHPALPAAWKMGSQYRFYVCNRCGAGPVRVDVMLGKANINKTAVMSGILSDCNAEMVRRVLDA